MGWVSLVRDLAERLTNVRDFEELGSVVSGAVRSGLGATAVIFALLSDDAAELRTLVADGVTGDTAAQLSKPLPFDDSVPMARVLSGGRPILWPTLSSRNRDFPEYAERASNSRAWAILPLSVHGSPVGAISIGWPASRRFGDAEVTILEVIAHQCALAVDRVRLDTARRNERDTLELLSEGTQLMVSALDPDSLVEALVHLAVPRLAPWCAVFVTEGEGLRRVAIEISVDGGLAAELRGKVVSDLPATHPLAVALRTGETVLVHPIDSEIVRAGVGSPEAGRVLESPHDWTSLVVPIVASGAAVGVFTLVSPDWKGKPPDQVWFAAEGLAGRAGVALANARRFEEERLTATTLVRAFLPERLPEIPGYDVAARYLPAGARVAGDWYDVAPLPRGDYLVGIGDAGGHGIEAASLMGQLRNGARSLAVLQQSPQVLVDGLRLVAEQESNDAFATLAYGVLDPRSHTLRWTSAGHLPLLHFGPGSAAYVEDSRERPLGCPSPAAREHVLALGEGEGVVLVTDGVVERRDVGIEKGMDRLRALVADRDDRTAAELTDEIVDSLCQSPDDDCCILVLKRR